MPATMGEGIFGPNVEKTAKKTRRTPTQPLNPLNPSVPYPSTLSCARQTSCNMHMIENVNGDTSADSVTRSSLYSIYGETISGLQYSTHSGVFEIFERYFTMRRYGMHPFCLTN